MSPAHKLTAVKDRLEVLTVADAIRADLAAGDAGYRAAGEKFLKQKKELGHGLWLPWLEKEGFSVRQAQRLMEFAKSDVNVAFTDICNPEPQPSPDPTPATTAAAPAVLPEPKPSVAIVLPDREVVADLVDDQEDVPSQPDPDSKAVNEQPAPKKLKPGSPAWVEEQVEAIRRASDNLQSLYPKLNRYQQERITTAQKALGHVVRIGANSTQVNQVSLELVRLWNQQGGEQVEVEGYLMRGVKEAVAHVPYVRAWKQVIEKIYAAIGVTWFTSEHFEWLTETRDQSDLEDLEKEWGTPVAPESAEVALSKVMP